MALTLWCYKGSLRANASFVAAKFNGVDLEQPAFEMGKDNKTPEFLAKNPTGKVPVLETPEGCLFESSAILRYVAGLRPDRGLLGGSYYETALVNQWIDFVGNELVPQSQNVFYQMWNLIPKNKALAERGKADTKKAIGVLNNVLQSRTYLVGEQITAADIAAVCSLVTPFRLYMDANDVKPYSNVLRWFNTCMAHKAFSSVLGKAEFCAKAPVFEDGPGVAAVSAAAAPKKEAKKPAASDDADTEGDAPKKDKSPHWSELLPESSMVMDEWKRCYSNNDTRPVAIPEFWKMFDKNGYSIWHCEYKYQDELEKLFMTCNLVGGWFQRLDRVRKFAFANIMIFGDNNKQEIEGIWLFRGHEIPPEMLVCDDSELYVWRRLDTDDAPTRELINDFWAWDGTFGGTGRVCAQGKTFK